MCTYIHYRISNPNKLPFSSSSLISPYILLLPNSQPYTLSFPIREDGELNKFFESASRAGASKFKDMPIEQRAEYAVRGEIACQSSYIALYRLPVLPLLSFCSQLSFIIIVVVVINLHIPFALI